jgi:hypothetical protein
MKFLSGWMGAIALAMMCVPAIAAEGETKKRAKAKAPQVHAEPVELDKRVAESKFIFLGEGVRIYFLDRQYRETPYIRAADDGRMKSAVLVVKIVKPLQPAKGDLPAQILVPISTDRDIYGDGRSHYDHLVARHVGKQGIWFGDFETRSSYGDPKAPRPLEDPVTFFRSKSGTTPLPEKQLKEVVASINSKAEGARRKAEGSSAKPAAPVESEPKTAAAEGK